MNCVDGCKYFEEVTGDYYYGYCRISLPHWVSDKAYKVADTRKVHGLSYGCDLGIEKEETDAHIN